MLHPMKALAACLSLFLLLPALVHAQTTGYEALRLVAQQKGEAYLRNFVQMRGDDGAPQPPAWTLIFAEPAARGGVREFLVSKGAIVSESTPVRPRPPAAPPAFELAKLNLDSTGVFTLVNKEAVQARMPFDRVNYLLRNAAGVPVWEVSLFDVEGIKAGSIRVAAADGQILQPLRAESTGTAAPRTAVPSVVKPAATSQAAATPKPVGRPAPAPTPAPGGEDFGERWKEGGGLFGVVGRSAADTGRTLQKTGLKVAGAVQVFFTGRNTVDPEATPSPRQP